MENFVELIAMLLGYYITFGLMATGFAMMLRGPKGARTVARWFFLRPVVLLIKKSWEINISIVRWMLGLPPKKKKN